MGSGCTEGTWTVPFLTSGRPKNISGSVGAVSDVAVLLWLTESCNSSAGKIESISEDLSVHFFEA